MSRRGTGNRARPSAARSSAANWEEANLFEKNARSLLTFWGGPVLFDYATREWAGLIRDFHADRWRQHFEARERTSNGSDFKRPDYSEWERAWATSTLSPTESRPEELLPLVQELLDRYRQFDHFKPTVTGHPLRLGPFKVAPDGNGFDVDLGKLVSVAGVIVFPVFGQGCLAKYSIEWGHQEGDGRGLSSNAATYRGARWSFHSENVQHIRINVRCEVGDQDQQFRVYVFEQESPTPINL